MILRRTLLVLLFLGLASCAGVPKLTKQAFETAEEKFLQGEYTEAARLFNGMAGQARKSSSRAELLMRAAASMAKADLIPQARETLDNIQLDKNNRFQVFLFNLSQSHLALAERRPADVFGYLRSPPPRNTRNRYRAEYYKLRAEAYTMQGNRLETARELVKREAYLKTSELIEKNQTAIWDALTTLTTRALQQLRTSPPPDVLSGWMHLVQIAKSYQLDPVQLKRQVTYWRRQYPKHPVRKDVLDGLSTRKKEDVAIPNQIALLLPFSSKYATAAEAVRDGFLAAYYSHPDHQNQSIRIYDVGDDPGNVLDVYDQAITEGAQFIVGPLDKDAVTKMANQEPLPVPTLALNYSQEENSEARNLFQFGLSPEEEARQVAERTWLDGHVYATILSPAGPWGDRVKTAFKERWEFMGGKVVEEQSYDPGKNDFSGPIRTLLDIDESEHRSRKLITTLKRDVKFSPRRRKDVDFIFLAAFPKQARAIRPQLKFFHATEVPVYATSHIFTGNLNQEKDRDMDGMLFGDMPWVLAETTSHRSLRSDIERQISKAGNSFQRLYALGIDAFNIIGALNPLRKFSYERYDGETGSLSLDVQQRVRRQLTWVKFRSGHPRTIDQATQ
ncbi:MAG: penicillin-binding protein activator [Gammaproteobacteria bacterium]|nr:penicillin-binding protein activator [Gammaproteobacteria bacterium]MDH5777906.1 penicillin-binding protein activator [Gammaproteobacteria bacterium]